MAELLDDIWKILEKHEAGLRSLMGRKRKRKPSKKPQLEEEAATYKGVHLALCMDTRDPFKQGRVRYYSPVLSLPDVQIDTLDWAWPISSMGGFDDSGLTWVPPAGSTLCMLFQNGSASAAFYIGTTWQRNRGPVGERNWGIPIDEFYRLHEGNRGGYMVGANDESQVFPPWNTDNYQGFDLGNRDVENQLNAGIKATWPHQFGFTTTEKHRFKADDGDPKCNYRWKRLEIISSTGQLFLMKDDPYHPTGEWLNPSCGQRAEQDTAASYICTDTYFCQWEITDATIDEEGEITITVADFQPPEGCVASCPAVPLADSQIAISGIPGIIGAEGTWTVDGGNSFVLQGSSGEYEGEGFYQNPESPVYAIFVDEFSFSEVACPAECAQGPDPTECPISENTAEVTGFRTGPISGVDVSTLPATITTRTEHGLVTGARITLIGISGISDINGSWFIEYVSSTQFTLQGSDTTPNPPTASPKGYADGSGIWSITVADEYIGTEGLCHGHTPPADKTLAPYDPAHPLNLKQRYDALKLGHCNTLIDALNECMVGTTGSFVGKNKYHKHRQECAPYLTGKGALDQAGIQLLSRSGHTWVASDSVEEPRGIPNWELSLQPYDMDGCTGIYTGCTFWESATKHVIEMNDSENQHGIRGPKNGIHIRTACGNSVCLSDHSLPCCKAGDTRGVHIQSTSKHTIDLSDAGNEQCAPERSGCGKPTARANKAFVRIRSGYGLTLTMNDAYSQTNTNQQYIQLMAPQTDNLERGPHILHMQEQPDGPGQVFLRAGGDFIVHSYDNMVEVVGVNNDAHDTHLANKLEFVSNRKIVSVGDYYYSTAKTHLFWSDDYIFLLAGKDCTELDGDGNEVSGPCVYPVVVACQAIPEFITQQYGIKASERVFASAMPCKEPCLV